MYPHKEQEIIAKARNLTVHPNDHPDNAMVITTHLFEPTVEYSVTFYKAKVAGEIGWAVQGIRVIG